MKRLLVGVLLLALAVLPLKAQAINVTYNTFIGAANSNCEENGYISPSTNTANAGDVLTINFKNEQTNALNVVGIPGGTFAVAAGATVTKSFTVSNTIDYSIRLVSNGCHKAAAIINVTPAPTPSPAPSTPSSSTPQDNTSSTAADTDEVTEELDSAEEAVAEATDTTEKTDETMSNSWFLLLLLLQPLVWLVMRTRRKKHTAKKK